MPLNGKGGGGPPGLLLADAWATFTKVAAVFPESCRLVRQAFTAMQEGLSAVFSPAAETASGRLAVLFRGNTMEVGGGTVDLAPGTNLAWLADRVRESALLGVAFHPEVDLDSLMRFTRRLLSNRLREVREPGFEELWPETYRGVDLIDLRFTGTFEESAPAGSSPRATRPASPETPPAPETDGDEALARLLEGDPRVRAALAALKSTIARQGAEGGATRELDILSLIVRHTPHDLTGDPGVAARIALEAIGELRRRVEAGPSSPEIVPVMTRNALEASRVLLGRSDPGSGESTAAADPAPIIIGDRDAAIEDDPEALVAEIAALPPPFAGRVALRDAMGPGEPLAVLLHFLADPAEAVAGEAARRHVFRLLAEPAAEVGVVLRRNLSVPCNIDDEEARGRRERLAGFLREAHFSHLLRTFEIVSVKGVLESFPAGFGLFLDSVDPQFDAEMAELERVLEELGRDRILAARQVLVHREGLLDPARAGKALALSSPAALPLIRIIVEEGGATLRKRVATALARIRGDEPAACALRFVHDPADLPRTYLVGLTDEPPGSGNRSVFRRTVASILCRFVRGTTGSPAESDARCAAIFHLALFREPEAEALLSALARGQRTGLLSREPRAIREAARSALSTGPARLFEGG
ncbi:MAG: hypothetical protein MUE73_01570 [Planctomycetes bacterium]|jgi:hypothetical protein|nr:hypothetical protein [Planctomycetota bacterium]